MITLGAFLGPLAPAPTRRSFVGGLYGDLLPPPYEIASPTSDFTYQVTVRPCRHGHHHR